VAGSDGAPPLAVPLDARRNGFLPGEGAALLLLEDGERAGRRGARIRGEILGHGAAFDPSRGTEPERAAGAVGRATRLALAAAGIAADDVGCVVVSASGGRAADAHEVRGVAAALGRSDVPLAAIQGQTGETLGASGALQAVAALASLAGGRLPGIHGWERADDDLPQFLLGGAPRGPLALVTSCGLDGTAAALVLGAGDSGDWSLT
jgi:3-oxoacyl-(acyl-carrier-protein) synthase